MSICYIELDGEMISRKEYCRRLGYNYNQICCLMRTHKVSFEQAIEECLKPIKERSWSKRVAKDKRLRRIWRHMLDRCYNPKNPNYHRYGGRGIIVQDSWHNYFNFEDDMYDSYIKHVEEYGEKDTSIDRFPNNDGNYEIDNVRWATQEEQNNNTCRNIKILDEPSLKQLSIKYNLPYNVVQSRHKRGWSAEKIISTPIQEQISFDDVYAPTGESVRELAKRLDIKEETIMGRIRSGWDWDRILETPLLANTPIIAPTGETFKELSERLGIPVKTLRCRYERGWDWDKILNAPIDKGYVAPTGESLRELSERLNIPVGTLQTRIKRKWTWEEIINTPLGGRRKKHKD